MSSAADGQIYTGAWIDWSRGAVLGSTITLSDRWGAALTAFLAFFVTVIGACLWRSLCFTIHQLSASPDAKDGIYHQHQLVFRNTSSPIEAVRLFFETAFFWRKNCPRAWLRSLPLSIFALLFMLSFAAASLLTSLVTKAAGDQRLVVSDNCGFFGYDPQADITTRVAAQQQHDLNDTLIASAYTKNCYNGNSERNNLECNIYTKPELLWSAMAEAECPFESSMCLLPAYRLDTGLLSSHSDFGINAPSGGRINFRKVTTCAPITQVDHTTVVQSDGTDGLGLEGDTIHKYQYGTFAAGGIDSNTTYTYNTHSSIDGFGYSLSSTIASPDGTTFLPIDTLSRTDADVTLMFLASNSITYYTPNTDPFFSATLKQSAGTFSGVDMTYYKANNWVTVMGCTDQYQFCNPLTSICTPLSGYAEAAAALNTTKLNNVQYLVASRIALNTRAMSIHHSISGRGASALRAQELVSENSQNPIPNNQWQIEVDSWFATSFARLQRAIVEYASGPAFVPAGTYVQSPTGPISKAMCYSQKVRLTADTVSFSVLGLSIILAVGALVICIYLVLETIVGMIQKRYKWGDHRRLRWIMDDKIQIQRMAFEEAGMGTWENLSGNVPVTTKGDVFGSLEHVDPKHPRLGERWTSVEKGEIVQEQDNGGGQGSGIRGEGMREMPMVGLKAEQVVYQKPVYRALTPPQSFEEKLGVSGAFVS